MPRVGHGFWFFTLWQEFQFGDKRDIQSSSTTIVDVLMKVIENPRATAWIDLRGMSSKSLRSNLAQREPTFP